MFFVTVTIFGVIRGKNWHINFSNFYNLLNFKGNQVIFFWHSNCISLIIINYYQLTRRRNYDMS